MNRTTVSTPLVLAALAAVQQVGNSDRSALIPIVAAVVLQLLMVVITLRVNVPLNDAIKAAGDPRDIDVAAVREQFNEAKWVRWNSVRAATATVAFGCLVWALVLYAGS